MEKNRTVFPPALWKSLNEIMDLFYLLKLEPCLVSQNMWEIGRPVFSSLVYELVLQQSSQLDFSAPTLKMKMSTVVV